jgi:hypothetical protein
LQVKAVGLFPSSLSSGTNQRITSKHTKENVPSGITGLSSTNTLLSINNGRLSKHPKQLFVFVFVLWFFVVDVVSQLLQPDSNTSWQSG